MPFTMGVALSLRGTFFNHIDTSIVPAEDRRYKIIPQTSAFP